MKNQPPKYKKKFGKMHLIECPECWFVARADEDQVRGRVSIDCPECPYHQTHDLSDQIDKKG